MGETAAAVVPFPAPPRGPFRSFQVAAGRGGSSDADSAAAALTVPLVPAPFVAVGDEPSSRRPQRWCLVPAGAGQRWQPENSMIASAGRQPDRPTPSYSPEEYAQSLQAAGWDLEETSYLMELCDQFSFRFVVIADRYEWQGRRRSVEELRERYYGVASALAQRRDGEASVQAHAYDRAADQHYRLSLEKMHTERPVEAAQEEILLSEMLAQVRLSLPQIQRERERLLLTCAGLGGNYLAHQPSLPELTGAVSRPRKGSVSEAKRPHSKASKQGGATGGASGASARPADSKKKSRSGASLAGRHHGGSSADLEVWGPARPSSTAGAHHATTPGRKPKPPVSNTFARSTQGKAIRVGLTRQVDKMLLELGFGRIQRLLCTIGSLMMVHV